jgi:hypothetical protein
VVVFIGVLTNQKIESDSTKKFFGIQPFKKENLRIDQF